MNNEGKSKMERMLDELVTTSSSCIGYMHEKGELNKMEVNEAISDLKMVANKLETSDKKVFAFSDGKKKEVTDELVSNHPESLLNGNMIDIDSRNHGNEIEVDFRFKYLNEIVKYMNNEYDISELNGIEFDEFCRELIEMRIPFRMDIMNRICTGSNVYGVYWKKRSLIVNGKEYFKIFDVMKWSDIQYNSERNRIELIKSTSISSAIEVLNDFEYYLKAPSTYTKNDSLKVDDIISLFYEIGIDISTELVKNYLLNYTCSFFCYGSKVLENSDYDSKLREWCGDYKWKLIYRASEHDYTGKSFHEYCDDKGPTLVIIKSSDGWIFGGYTTKSWSGYGIYFAIRD